MIQAEHTNSRTSIDRMKHWGIAQKVLWLSGTVFLGYKLLIIYVKFGSLDRVFAFIFGLFVLTFRSSLIVGGIILIFFIGIQEFFLPRMLASEVHTGFLIAWALFIFTRMIDKLHFSEAGTNPSPINVLPISEHYKDDPNTKPCAICGLRLPESKLDLDGNKCYCRPCYLDVIVSQFPSNARNRHNT